VGWRIVTPSSGAVGAAISWIFNMDILWLMRSGSMVAIAKPSSQVWIRLLPIPRQTLVSALVGCHQGWRSTVCWPLRGSWDTIGGGAQSDIRDQRYRTEPDIGMSDIRLKCAESDIISDIGINFCPISDIQHQYTVCKPLYRSGKTPDSCHEVVSSKLVR
jgi:hypothetical protein